MENPLWFPLSFSLVKEQSIGGDIFRVSCVDFKKIKLITVRASLESTFRLSKIGSVGVFCSLQLQVDCWAHGDVCTLYGPLSALGSRFISFLLLSCMMVILDFYADPPDV